MSEPERVPMYGPGDSENTTNPPLSVGHNLTWPEPGRETATSTSEEYHVKHYGTDEEVSALVRLVPGSDKPGRWLWAENDTLANIAVYAASVRQGREDDVAYLLDAIGDLLPGTRRA